MLIFVILNLYLSKTIHLYSYDSSLVTLNNKSYRETLNSNYFVLDKYYNLDKPKNYKATKLNVKKDFLGTNLFHNYLIKSPKLIGNIKYNYPKIHNFNYIINLVSSDLHHLKLVHNNDTIYNSFNQVFSIFKKIRLSPGYHNFDLIAYNDNYICNCPSIKKGFSNTRYFYGFINENTNNIINLVKLNSF